MYYVMALGWLEKEERKKQDEAFLSFDCFRFATLKKLLHIAITTAGWGRLYKMHYVLLDASICSPAMILPCIMYTLIH